MLVRWSLEGVSYCHTVAETPDADCHEWQEPMEADELIFHAANLYLFRSYDPNASGPPKLWSLPSKVGRPLPEDRVRPRVQ